MNRPPAFGVVVPAGTGWDRAVDVAVSAEEKGYDSVWLRHGAGESGWVLVAALSQRTARIRLGVMTAAGPSPGPQSDRHPATAASMVAKISSTLDVISDGRCELSLVEPDEDTVRIILAMWTDQETTHGGVVAARCDPKPAQRPHPPLLIAGDDPATLAVAARHADGCLIGGSPDDFARTCDALEESCVVAGRAYEAITKTTTVAELDAAAGYIERGCERVLVETADPSALPYL